MVEPEKIQVKRWYDTQPPVKNSINLLSKFPPTFQVTLADGLSTLAERRYSAHQLIRNVKTMGKDKVLALYKSKSKQRQTDENPFFYTLGNYLLVLPSKQCQDMSGDMMHLMQGVIRYFKTCRTALTEPKISVISEITDTFVVKGRVFAERLIQDLEADIIQTIELSPTMTTSHSENMGEAIQDFGLGMRVKTTSDESQKTG